VICIPRYNIILCPVVENDRRVIQIFRLSYIIPRRKNNNITQNMYFVLFSSHWSHLYDFVRYPYNSRILLLLYTFCIWFVTVFLHTNIINIYILHGMRKETLHWYRDMYRNVERNNSRYVVVCTYDRVCICVYIHRHRIVI
jgi:hypothetical protein